MRDLYVMQTCSLIAYILDTTACMLDILTLRGRLSHNYAAQLDLGDISFHLYISLYMAYKAQYIF